MARYDIVSYRLLPRALLLAFLLCTAVHADPDLRNQTNTTAERDQQLLLLYCERWMSSPIIYAMTVPFWFALTSYWAWSTYCAHAEVAYDLHRLLFWVPLVEVLHGTLSVFYYWSCPWASTGAKVLAAIWVVLSILKEPIILVCLLMVSKGWCITRASLTSSEVAVSSTIVTCLYAAVIVQMAMRPGWAIAPVLLLYAGMLVNVMSSIFTK